MSSESTTNSCNYDYIPVPYSESYLSTALDDQHNPNIVANFSVFEQKYVTIQSYESDPNIYVINFNALMIDYVYSRTIFDDI